MDLSVFMVVLLGAMFHAVWNAIIRFKGDRFGAIVLLSAAQSGMALLLLPFFPLPLTECWPWLAVSGLVHVAYKVSLARAYESADLSLAYPLARGTAPMIVALISLVALGDHLSLPKTIGIMLIGSGIVGMGLAKTDGAFAGRKVIFPLITALTIASYTLIDAIGARLSGSASAFVLWVFTLDGLGIVAYALWTRGTGLYATILPQWKPGVLAGALSLASYWLVIWAFTVAPVALVAALRETSVLFAIVLAKLFLKEEIGPLRWAAAGLIMAGTVALRL